MNDRVKDIIVSVLFLSIIIGFCFLNIISKDKNISYSERRKLKQFPNITAQKILDNDLNDEIEEYVMDQFILRDKFRSIKTFVKLDILNQKDNNQLFIINGNIYKTLYPLNEKSIGNFSNKINNIYERYLKGNTNIYFTIVPDKNFFLEEKYGYLKLNKKKLFSLTGKKIDSNIKYIDITDTLDLDCYYNTDAHWSQDKIINTARKIANDMGFLERINTDFEKKEYGEFFGGYYGQLGKNIQSDNIYYLTNEIIENALTYNYETQKESKIYDFLKANNSMDKYDLFLSGATPIIQIRNSNATTDKELLIFRDSFGSSIAPLFTQAYSKITLIDIRYISTDLISNYVKFNDNQDVLFLYSTLLINESGSLK